MSTLRQRLDSQLGRPQGPLRRGALAVLNVANGSRNRATVDALALAPGERILDLGFGGGVGLRRAVKTGAEVVAIEPSDVAPARVTTCHRPWTSSRPRPAPQASAS